MSDKREFLEDPVLIYRREMARMKAKRAEAMKGVIAELKAELERAAEERTMAKKGGGRKPKPITLTRKKDAEIDADAVVEPLSEDDVLQISDEDLEATS